MPGISRSTYSVRYSDISDTCYNAVATYIMSAQHVTDSNRAREMNLKVFVVSRVD